MKRDRPISSRVTRMVVMAVTLGISAGVGLFLVYDFTQAMKVETARYQSAAFAFGAAAGDALAVGDERKVLEVLRGTRQLPEVTYIAALDVNGRVLAEIGTGVSLVGGMRSLPLFDRSVRAVAQVLKSGEPVGSIVLDAEVTGLRQRYIDALISSGSIGLVLVLVTALLSRSQVRRILAPFKALASEFEGIGQDGDLKRRLVKLKNDEVGVLVDAFNDMFGRIDTRDRLLEQHRAGLERTVLERTAQLSAAKDEAERANAAKSDFLATMSHEIRTPMNGMLVMAEMLAAAPLAPRHMRYAEIITRSGKNLLHIINDILDFAKIESGRVELEEVEFSLDAVVDDVACLFAERAREKGLTLATFVASSVPRRSIGDPTRLSQVLGNLVNNALKFTESGGVTIIASAAEGTGNISIAVRDTGIGIEADQLDRIFTRFSQADATITRRFGGTGLGLSISRLLTEAMGGALQVSSDPGRGSTFVVSLDLPVAEAATPVKLDVPADVLLLDHDPISSSAVELLLIERGFNVTRDPASKPDITIASALYDGIFPHLPADVPFLLLRPFAGTTPQLPIGVEPVAELPAPVSRQGIDQIVRSLESGDFSIMDERSSSAFATALPDLSDLKVLAVDDVAVNREVLGEALRSFGIVADLASNASEAISKTASSRYDLVFMDCSMPDMDGFEATSIIRKSESDRQAKPAYVVALTGHVMGRDAQRWKEAGMDDYLAKPFSIEQLAGILRQLRSTDFADPFATSGSSVVASSPGYRSEPLLSDETLTMFETIRTTTGTDIRSKVFAMFRSHMAGAIDELEEEIAQKGENLKAIAHAMKSNCTSAGAVRLSELCEEIECHYDDVARCANLSALMHPILADTLAAMLKLEKTPEAATLETTPMLEVG